MTTGNGDHIRQKALMYAFGKIHGSSIVSVNETPTEYWVRLEDGKPGKYYWKVYPHSTVDSDIIKDIGDALRQLRWIQEGNEFPT